MSSESIEILVHLRPKLETEASRQDVVNINEEGKICISDGETYLEGAFSKFYPPESSSSDLYSNIAPKIQRCFKGENCSVIVYGAPNSGKTFTLFGKDFSLQDGLLQLALQQIFTLKQEMQGHQFEVSAQFVLVETEKVGYQPKIDIIEDPIIGVYLQGAKLNYLDSVEQSVELLKKGWERAQSLTSQGVSLQFAHLCLMFYIESTQPNQKGLLKRSRLVFAEVAGSEKSKKRNVTVIKPTVYLIQQLLMGTGKEALTGHQDSKLTHMIRDCILPRSRSVFLATLGPTIENAAESLNMLATIEGIQGKMTQITKTVYEEGSQQVMEAMLKILKHLKKVLKQMNPEADIQKQTFDNLSELKLEIKRIRELVDTNAEKIFGSTNRDKKVAQSNEVYDLSLLLGKRGAELQDALEDLRKKEIKYAADELSSKLPTLGRCPICTLKIPCKHFESIDDAPPQKPPSRGRSLSPILKFTLDGNDLQTRLPIKEPAPSSYNAKGFKIRYRGPGMTVEQGYSHTSPNKSQLSDIRRLKLMEKLETYREEKLRKEIERIEELKKLEEKQKRKSRISEERRIRYLNKQKQKLADYHSEMAKRKEMQQKYFADLEKKTKMDLQKRQKYLEDQKKKIADYHQKKRMMDGIKKRQISELEADILRREDVREGEKFSAESNSQHQAAEI